MSLRQRILIGLAASGLVIALALFFSFLGHRDNSHPTQPAQRCEEDMPCFDYHTMGDLRCGPTRGE